MCVCFFLSFFFLFFCSNTSLLLITRGPPLTSNPLIFPPDLLDARAAGSPVCSSSSNSTSAGCDGDHPRLHVFPSAHWWGPCVSSSSSSDGDSYADGAFNDYDSDDSDDNDPDDDDDDDDDDESLNASIRARASCGADPRLIP